MIHSIKKLLLLLLTIAAVLTVRAAAMEKPLVPLSFPKGLPADKEKFLIDRITTAANAVRNNDYYVLQKLWNYPLLPYTSADGGFDIRFLGYGRADRNADGTPIVDPDRCFNVGVRQINAKLFIKGRLGSGTVNTGGMNFRSVDKLKTYSEFTYILNSSVIAQFDADKGTASDLSLSFGSESSLETFIRYQRYRWDGTVIQPKQIHKVLYTWDNSGKLTTEGNVKLLDGLAPAEGRFAVPAEKEKHKYVDWGKVPKMPQIKKSDKQLQEFLDRMNRIMSADKFEKFVAMIDEIPVDCLADKKSAVSNSWMACNIQIRDWKCRSVQVHGSIDGKDERTGNPKRITFACGKDAAGSPLVYIEGTSVDLAEHELEPSLSNYGGGVVVRFHANGMPKSYRSLVRGRLFGRQIKWDEKGKIVSDVDLDEPVIPPDIQKALGGEKAKK